ncbi:MAG: N-acetylmuramic acid 6-phosphate etherase [Bacilli bacterium]|nr:N-acetylmuramic acid 6-phosphate etherase [Bacilli bacterium]
MAVDLKKISTESRNQNTLDIDIVPTLDILKKINNEDKTIAIAVEIALPSIAEVVDKVYDAFIKGGRLIYMGAGTSGRIGILDAVECPPTYGVDYNMVQCLMAGGEKAFIKAVEGAEDSFTQGKVDLENINLSKNDIVIGIAASGRTPYVIGGLNYANEVGAITSCITTSANSIIESIVKYPIVAVTGPEPITGSTRMKSGTAQKMICNMISTASMVKMGKVYENLMIDVKATNEKLVSRSLNIICTILECSVTEAKELLDKYHTVKKVIFASFTNETDNSVIDECLNKEHGNIRKAIKFYKENK